VRFGDLFRRGPNGEDEFSTLEASLADAMLDEDMGPEASAPAEDVVKEEIDVSDAAASGTQEQTAPAITEYAQARLTEAAAYEHVQNAAAIDLDAVSVAVSQMKTAQRQTKEFLNGVYASIHRLSELETANTRLLAENRTLFRQAEYVGRLRSQQDGLVEAFKQREEKLIDAADAARRSLAAVKLELVEAQTQATAHLTERHHLQKSLSAASTQSERTMRENEVLRERLANFTADLEVASRRRVEAERKLDEVAALQTRDAADNAELRQHLSTVEAERQRVQKQLEGLQTKHAEGVEALKVSEAETLEQARRHEVSLVNLRNERDMLAARLDHLEKAHAEASQKVAALTAALDDALTRRLLIEAGPASAEPATNVIVERRNGVSKVRTQVAERVVADHGRRSESAAKPSRV
jgi:hypothetical protein